MLPFAGSANPGNIVKPASIIIALIVLAALLAPTLTMHDPRALSGAQFEAPSARHWLGTDQLGRDVFSRLLFGARRSLGISGLATALAMSSGVMLGTMAAIPNAWLSRSIRAIVDALLALPGLLWSLVVITLLGSGTDAIIFAVGSAQIAPVARVVYSRSLSVYSREYVLAARALGANESLILRQHILPNCASVIFAYAAVVFSYSLLNGAALTFLGLAGVPGIADWGVLLSEGRAAIQQAPWIALSAGCAITILVITVNHLAEELAAPR